MDFLTGIASQVVVRPRLLTGAYAQLGSLLGLATMVGQFSTGELPLEQLGTWAEAIGWNGGSRWLTDTAVAAFAPGREVWLAVAMVALLVSAIAVASGESSTELIGARVGSTLWIALAATAQAEELPLGVAALWYIPTAISVAVIHHERITFRQALAHTVSPLLGGLIAGPAILLTWMTVDNAKPSEKDRASIITRAVMDAIDEHRVHQKATEEHAAQQHQAVRIPQRWTAPQPRPRPTGDNGQT